MIIYDVTGGSPVPSLDASLIQLVGGTDAALKHGSVIRAVLDGDGLVSSILVGMPTSGGLMELLLGSHESGAAPEHHHVSILTARHRAYAEALGVRGFKIVYRKDRGDFLRHRFPEWTHHAPRRGHPVMTIEV